MDSIPSLRGAPDIYQFDRYTQYLNAWVEFLRSSGAATPKAELAKIARISLPYFSLILSGKRKLNSQVRDALSENLRLDEREVRFFQALVRLNTEKDIDARVQALDEMRSQWRFRSQKPAESEAFGYLSKSYIPTIREMAAFDDFRLDADWIRSRLVEDVPKSEIEKAVKFLLKHQLIERVPGGRIRPSKKVIRCDPELYRVSLAAYHKKMLGRASEAIFQTPRRERNITGLTVAINEEAFDEVRDIIDTAVAQIVEVARRQETRNAVYHVNLVLFPTATSKPSKADDGSQEV
ncbi:MAG: DUF4423 domain-containing protein [Bacteriovoracia bacterium]